MDLLITTTNEIGIDCCEGDISTVKEVHVEQLRWDKFGRGVASSVRLQTTAIRKKNQPRVHFFCLGDPIWVNPMTQNKNVTIVSVELHPDGGKELRTKIKRTVNGILKRRLVSRVNGEGSVEVANSTIY
jgi:hypothetical protein